MGDIVHLPPQRPREGIRYISVSGADGEFMVGIEYWDGGYVFAGVFVTHLEALESARAKAQSLGSKVVDFTFSEPPLGGAA
ncbi:hypothetical protein K7W03_16170 [Sphingobium sp. PNB]|uniref:hypothetical protein n=1 Tax=Sphingobium sp. PNB TaxID=863934 RepID=UPI001CA42185|nr:hypothetical protein [Sphingobium sp. PNB]MCB4861128.1 hypothetical protein [Sphingobium sp. PNB]